MSVAEIEGLALEPAPVAVILSNEGVPVDVTLLSATPEAVTFDKLGVPEALTTMFAKPSASILSRIKIPLEAMSPNALENR